MLELQGKLETDNGSWGGATLGKLCTNEKNPWLLVGCHKLLGRWQDLKKPLVILHERDNSTDLGDWQIETVLRRKLIFNRRPEHHVNLID
jgi:hypothetical protein